MQLSYILRWAKFSSIVFLFFFSLDLFWNRFVVYSFFLREIGPLLRLSPKGFLNPILPAAALSWIALVAGLLIFAVVPILKEKTWHLPALQGSLYGIIIYTIYETTNLALLANWSIPFVIVDIVWGTVLCTVSTLFAWYININN